MTRKAHARQRSTWITLWAMLLSTCLPVLSHAAAQLAEGAQWTKVCTSTGMVWVRTEPADPTGKSAPEAAEVACSWCLMTGGTPGLPPAAGVLLASTEPAGSVSSHLTHRVWLPAVWSLAQPRAPPVVL